MFQWPTILLFYICATKEHVSVAHHPVILHLRNQRTCFSDPRSCYFSLYKTITCGPGSSVSVATTLRIGQSGDRIPVGVTFSAPVQTGPEAHPASCTMGTRSFPEVKSGRGVTLTSSPPSSAVGHDRVELYLYSPYVPYGLYRASV